jgi:hypothetical protein
VSNRGVVIAPAGGIDEGAEKPPLSTLQDHELRMPLDTQQERVRNMLDRLNDAILVNSTTMRADLKLSRLRYPALHVKTPSALVQRYRQSIERRSKLDPPAIRAAVVEHPPIARVP